MRRHRYGGIDAAPRLYFSSMSSPIVGAPSAFPTKYCQSCATVLDARAVVCPRCGVPQPRPAGLAADGTNVSEKRLLVAFLLCFFLGVFGAHRFYVGKIGTGLLQLFTFGGLGIWAFIDLIFLVVGAFRDREGSKVSEWT